MNQPTGTIPLHIYDSCHTITTHIVLLQPPGGKGDNSGAFLLKARDLDLQSIALAPLAVGFVVAALSGWGALVLLLKLVNAGDFSRFAYYLLPLSAFALLTGLLG